MDDEHVLDDLVLYAKFSGGIFQEPKGPLEGPLIELGVFGAE